MNLKTKVEYRLLHDGSNPDFRVLKSDGNTIECRLVDLEEEILDGLRKHIYLAKYDFQRINKWNLMHVVSVFSKRLEAIDQEDGRVPLWFFRMVREIMLDSTFRGY